MATIKEDYKEKLKEALNSDNTDYEVVLWIEQNFPELKESEDERIIKFISNELACLRATDEKGSDRYKELTNAIAWVEKQGEQNTNHKTMIVNFLCKKDWHGIGDYCCGKIYNGYPCEKEQKGYDIYDDNHIPTFCDEDFINEYFNIVTEEKQDEQKPTDKIEPKFRNGQWIVWQDKMLQSQL